MSDFKFSCPVCNQRLQCEKASMGDTISCPGCDAHIRIPFGHTPVDPVTLVPHGELIPDASASGQAPVEERERDIARAREAHPISVYPSMKPRLSYVLSGGTVKPGAEEPRKEDPASPEQGFAE